MKGPWLIYAAVATGVVALGLWLLSGVVPAVARIARAVWEFTKKATLTVLPYLLTALVGAMIGLIFWPLSAGLAVIMAIVGATGAVFWGLNSGLLGQPSTSGIPGGQKGADGRTYWAAKPAGFDSCSTVGSATACYNKALDKWIVLEPTLQKWFLYTGPAPGDA